MDGVALLGSILLLVGTVTRSWTFATPGLVISALVILVALVFGDMLLLVRDIGFLAITAVGWVIIAAIDHTRRDLHHRIFWAGLVVMAGLYVLTYVISSQYHRVGVVNDSALKHRVSPHGELDERLRRRHPDVV